MSEKLTILFFQSLARSAGNAAQLGDLELATGLFLRPLDFFGIHLQDASVFSCLLLELLPTQ
jgi:hypothetical protein